MILGAQFLLRGCKKGLTVDFGGVRVDFSGMEVDIIGVKVDCNTILVDSMPWGLIFVFKG